MKRFLVILLFCVPVHAADLNDYTAQYECRNGGPNCDVDVATYVAASCAQTITTADSAATINTKLNGGSSPVCIDKGDYTAKGTFTLTASGTAGARRVLRYYRSGDTDDDPWDQSAANRAEIESINLNGASYWIIHRLTFNKGNASGNAVNFQTSSSANNNIVNRSLATGGSDTIDINGGTSNNTIQNSVIRDTLISAGTDANCIAMTSGGPTSPRIVNNEIYNCSGHAIYTSGGTTVENLVIENNDVYVENSMYTDCAGNYDTGGSCAATETLLSLKAATAGSNVGYVAHNRWWGARLTDTSVCCISGTAGQAVSISDESGGSATYILFINNIVMDAPVLIQSPHSVAQGADNHHNSYIGNILFNTFGSGVDVEFIQQRASEFYLNTTILAYSWGDTGIEDSDIRCNVKIDAGNRISGTPVGSTQVDYNGYYGSGTASESNLINKTLSVRANSTAYSTGDVVRTTSTPPEDGSAGDFLYMAQGNGTSGGSPPTWCTTPACTVTDGSVTWKAIRGPYSFYRKLKTSAELVYIPYARMFSGAPDETLCPSGFASRTGIGVDNSQP